MRLREEASTKASKLPERRPVDVPRARLRCGRGRRAPLGHTRGSAPSAAPSASSSGPLLFAAQLPRATWTQPRAYGAARRPPGAPSVRASTSPHGSRCGSGERLRLRPIGNSLIKAGAGEQRDPSSKHLRVRGASDPSCATPREATPGAAGAGRDRRGPCRPRPRAPLSRRPAVLSRWAQGQGPRPQGPPKRRDLSGKGKQNFVV